VRPTGLARVSGSRKVGPSGAEDLTVNSPVDTVALDGVLIAVGDRGAPVEMPGIDRRTT
jgi:hypothetical protein